MFPKLAAVILALGVVACSLLALRQSRLQTASELAQTQLRIAHKDERLWLLRAEVSRRVAPEQVRRLAADLMPLTPMMPPGLGAPEVAQNAAAPTPLARAPEPAR